MSSTTRSRKIKKTHSPKSVAETVPVAIKESSETWSTTMLDDGTVLRLRPVVVEVERAVGQYTEDGSPVYVIKSGLIIDTKSPPELKKK